MKSTNLLSADEFFSSWNNELTLINSLQQNELGDIAFEGETTFIDIPRLSQLEKLFRFYFELEINIDGIETILQLLQRINELNDENIALRSRLHLVEKT